MKTLALTLLGTAILGTSAFAQGTLTFNNRIVGIVDFKVFSDLALTVPLDGTGFSAQLYVGAAGAASGSLTAVPGVSSTFRAAGAAGYFTSLGDVVIPGFAGGTTIAIQLRAWDNAGGTITSYEAALAANRAVGLSNVATSGALGGAGSPPATATSLAGINAFNIAVVPEPATLALAGIGGLGLLALRRKSA